MFVWYRMGVRRKSQNPRNEPSIGGLRQLIVHASSKVQNEKPRRVLHIEYAGPGVLSDGLELAIA